MKVIYSLPIVILLCITFAYAVNVGSTNVDGVVIQRPAGFSSIGNFSGIHNDLNGLQGGSSTERYHMSLAQYNNLGLLGSTYNASYVPYTGAIKDIDIGTNKLTTNGEIIIENGSARMRLGNLDAGEGLLIPMIMFNSSDVGIGTNVGGFLGSVVIKGADYYPLLLFANGTSENSGLILYSDNEGEDAFITSSNWNFGKNMTTVGEIRINDVEVSPWLYNQTLAGGSIYVPYTGATKNVSLGDFNIKAGFESEIGNENEYIIVKRLELDKSISGYGNYTIIKGVGSGILGNISAVENVLGIISYGEIYGTNKTYYPAITFVNGTDLETASIVYNLSSKYLDIDRGVNLLDNTIKSKEGVIDRILSRDNLIGINSKNDINTFLSGFGDIINKSVLAVNGTIIQYTYLKEGNYGTSTSETGYPVNVGIGNHFSVSILEAEEGLHTSIIGTSYNTFIKNDSVNTSKNLSFSSAWGQWAGIDIEEGAIINEAYALTGHLQVNGNVSNEVVCIEARRDIKDANINKLIGLKIENMRNEGGAIINSTINKSYAIYSEGGDVYFDKSNMINNGNAEFSGNMKILGNLSVKRPYAMFSDLTTQTITAPNSAQIVYFNTTEDNWQITISQNANITFEHSGDYLVELSAIVVTDTNNKHIQIWPQINGVNVPRSNTKLEIENAGTESVISVPFILDMEEGDVFRLMWASDDAGTQMIYSTNTSYSPETPSIIMTISKISEITE